MKLLGRKLIWLVLGLVVLSMQVNAQDKAFDSSVLSSDGKLAYELLLKTDAFRLGGFGIALQISKAESALNTLVKEARAIASLESLVENATPEGGLYALLGLRILKCNCFEEAFQHFLNRPELPARLIAELELNGTPVRLTIPAGKVQLSRGCHEQFETRSVVAIDIKSGKFDTLIDLNSKNKE